MSEYIEREAVLNILASKNAPWDGYQKVSELPAADVQPVKHGKWDVVEVEDVSTKSNLPITTIASMWCNQCNRFHNEIYYYGDPTEYANYCPHCGAMMDGEEPIGEDSNG